MKKIISAILMMSMILTFALTSCGGNGSESAGSGESSSSDRAMPGEGKRIALVSDIAGTQVFVLSMIDGLNASAEKYGFEPIVVECADSAAYEDNIRALVEEGTDLIIGGGWLSADPLNKIASEFPDKAEYALIDSEVEAENVKCISYREQEGAYLIGKIAASVVDEGTTMFGAVHVTQGPSSFKWRYGYMEGVKTIIPEAKFVFNYVGNYNDPAQAKECALLQSEQGCQFINSAAAGGDIGVFEAALEKNFYTSGQDVDLTDPDNPYIVSCQIKDTKATVEYLMDMYFSADWDTDDIVLGVAEGAIGAVHITHETPNPISDRLSEEEISAVKQAAEDIGNGKIDLANVPDEENYQY